MLHSHAAAAGSEEVADDNLLTVCLKLRAERPLSWWRMATWGVAISTQSLGLADVDGDERCSDDGDLYLPPGSRPWTARQPAASMEPPASMRLGRRFPAAG